MGEKMSNTVDESEIKKFSAIAEKWWDETGPMKPLHLLNPIRLDYIRNMALKQIKGIEDNPVFQPLAGLQVLDVGCGAGLVAEHLARMGATVVGIDASSAMIEAAKLHQSQSYQDLSLDYRHCTIEELSKSAQKFDMITALEIIEHVADPPEFINHLGKLIKPNGLLFMSTLNKNMRSFLLGIVAAEYILRLLPIGTHQWQRFIRPADLVAMVSSAGLQPIDLIGVRYNPFSQKFTLHKHDLSVNYMACFRHQAKAF